MAHLLSVWLRLPIEWRWWWHCQEVLFKTKKTQFSVCVLANDDNQHDNERVTEWLSAFLSSPSSSLCICWLPLFLSLTLITMCCPLSTDHYTQSSTCHDTNHSSWTVSFSLARFTLHSIAIILMDISITILAGGCTKALAHCLCHQVVFSFFFCPLSKWQLSQWKSEQLPPAPPPQLYCARWPDSDFSFFFFVLFLVTVNWLWPDEFADTAVHKPGKGVAV